MKRIGIVGLGIMGTGMADNYLKSGYELYVWNCSIAKCEQLAAKGAIVCDSPKEVSESADIVFEVTANDESSRTVWLGDNGILAGADSNNILIASGTFTVNWIDELIAICAKEEVPFLDIPLTGGRVGAETGSLTLLAGGDEVVLDKIKSDLEPISAKTFYFGRAGSGMRYKLILQLMQSTHMAIFGEAMRIARSAGMYIDKVSEALIDRPGGAVTKIAADAYRSNDPLLTFSVDWITKDLEYATKLAKGEDTPILDSVLNQFRKAIDAGYGEKDWSYVNKLGEEKK